MSIPNSSNTSYSFFRAEHLLPNLPVLLPPSVTASWAALHSPSHAWSSPRANLESGHDPAYSSLTARYGHLSIEVTECGPSGRAGGAEIGLPGTLAGLLALWQGGGGRSLYLKDWHLPRILAAEGKQVGDELYEVADEWEDDWLNAFWVEDKGDDFRFLYLGGGGTFTPLHRDVFASYSISTNLHGAKLWTLFPPECAPALLELLKEAERSPLGDGSVDVRSWSPERRAAFEAAGMVQVRQERGETIFIPSGWYHQVENLSHPTFSLNHNWINAHSLVKVYDTLERDVAAARASIEDVRELLQTRTEGRPAGWQWEPEFESCVREMVAQNSGWEWTTFWRMVRHALRRLAPGPAPTVLQAEWPLCLSPLHAQPPIGYVLDQLRPLIRQFRARVEAEVWWTDGLEEVVAEVEREVGRLDSVG